MAIMLTHVFTPTDDDVLNPKEHLKFAHECPAGKLPGVIGINVYRQTEERRLFGDVQLENYAALDTWEAWWATPEGDERRKKFWSTGKFVKRMISEKIK